MTTLSLDDLALVSGGICDDPEYCDNLKGMEGYTGQAKSLHPEAGSFWKVPEPEPGYAKSLHPEAGSFWRKR